MACVISPIIKVTEMCNFDCVFCRYSNHKQNTGIMNVDIVKKILEESAEINAETNQKVKVLFHGGEPLLWGIERFYEILDRIYMISNSSVLFRDGLSETHQRFSFPYPFE